MPSKKTTSFLAIVTFLFNMPTNAALWSFEPSFNSSLEYDDNRFLTVDDEESAWSVRIGPRVNFRATEENRGLSGSAELDFQRSFSQSNSNRRRNDDDNDIDLNIGMRGYLNTELSSYNAYARAARDKTSETQTVATDPVDADSISENATRTVISTGAGWSRILSEKTTLNLDYSHSALRYTDTLPNSTLVESDTDSISAGIRQRINSYISANISASYSNFRPSTNLDSETVSLTGGLAGRFNETISGEFSIGRRETKFDTRNQKLTGFCIGAEPGSGFPGCTGGIPVTTGSKTINDDDNDTGLTYNVNLRKQFETSSLGVLATRAAAPNNTNNTDGNSGVLDRTTINIYGGHRLTERLRAKSSLILTEREDISSSGNDTDRRQFLSFSASIIWRWYPDLQLAAVYTYRENERADTSETASGNSITFNVNYVMRGIDISR